MAISKFTNLPGDGIQKPLLSRINSMFAQLADAPFSLKHFSDHYAAFLENTPILVALHKESSLHPPSKLLFRNLATTDLCVGIIVEPLGVTYWMPLVNKRLNSCHYSLAASRVTSRILCAVSLLTLATISMDRLLALLFRQLFQCSSS